MPDQTRHQIVAVGAGDRVFAGGENLGDADQVGVVEAGTEILEQGRQAGVAVRLVHGDHARFGAVGDGLARGLQDGGDFDGMVSVVVDDGDPTDFADPGESGGSRP